VTARTALERWYPETAFGGFTHVDGTIAFYVRVNGLLDADSVVLDLGCGRGAGAEDSVPWRRELRDLRGEQRRVIGVDLDPAAAANPTIDEFRLMETEKIPLSDESVDVCVADVVVEHVQDVDAFFSEVVRVLRPGGYVCIRTPNAWSYMGIASRAIPNRLHARVLARIQPDRDEADVFPTVYRCNSIRRLRRAFDRHSLEGVIIAHESEPAYLSFSRVLYALAVFHQRHAPRALRRTLLAFARRPFVHSAEPPAAKRSPRRRARVRKRSVDGLRPTPGDRRSVGDRNTQ
jgi:SAM-dependent methyltransferase